MNRSTGLPAAAILLLIAFALRCWDFGSPIIHLDEQYYLLVGQRILDGAIPYLDIWDRKPVGLFLLYAGLAALPGDPIWTYQIAATLVAATTAWVVWRAARALGADQRGALAASVAYLLWLSLLGGRGGQSPVFYNLPVATGALLTLTLSTRSVRATIWSGVAACLLAGIAIQMKYAPLFEGAFFGLAHIWRLRQVRARWVAPALLWLAAGLLPTMLALGWYAAQGQSALDAFWFANFVSILHRPGYPADQLTARLAGIATILSPLIAAALVAWRRGRMPSMLTGWLTAATLGFFAVGAFFDHYALPLVAPLAVAASLGFTATVRLIPVVLIAGTIVFAAVRTRIPNEDAGVYAVARLMRANANGACPYVFMGDPILYYLADACLPTRYAFPHILAFTTEQGANGVDEAAEVGRILAGRPPVIVATTRRLTIWNSVSRAELRGALARDYRPVYSVPRYHGRAVVFLRRDLPLRR